VSALADWFDVESLNWTLAMVGIAAAAVGLWRWARPRWRAGKKDAVAMRDTLIGRGPVLDSITGEELSPALPGVGVQMVHTKAQLEFAIGKLHEIEHEVTNNDGSSIKDSVDRIEARMRSGDGRFDELAGEIANLRETLGTLAQAQPALWSAVEAVARATPPDYPEGPDL
jgi:hypothetical protein